MDDLEWNKIFAAILVAGIIAMLSGFIADKVIHPEVPEESVINIDTSAIVNPSNAPAKAKPEKAEPVAPLMAEADPAKGEKLFRACAACHTPTKGGPNRVGPNLWDIVGRIRGANPDFAYSQVFETWEEEGKTWNYGALNQYLWKPKKFAPGTKMNYIGMKKVQDRADMIAYLRSLSENPEPLPKVQETAEAAPSAE